MSGPAQMARPGGLGQAVRAPAAVRIQAELHGSKSGRLIVDVLGEQPTRVECPEGDSTDARGLLLEQLLRDVVVPPCGHTRFNTR